MTKLKSPDQHQFSIVPDVKLQRSSFNRSHSYKSTFDAGYLIPIFIDEALPGDSFNLRMTAFCRMTTLIKPIMDNLYLDTFFFSVPYRLVWDNWVKFNGERVDPDDSVDYIIPQMNSGAGFVQGEIADYFGIPLEKADINVSALPFRAYNLIYNEWFRSQDLIDSLLVEKGDGPEVIGTDYLLRKRNKRHDYFTSCLPNPQKGDAVELPLGTSAPVLGNGYNVYMHDTAGVQNYLQANPSTEDFVISEGGGGAWGSLPLHFGLSADNTATGLLTDLSSATGATINSLRQAFQIQKLLERDQRAGTRYPEIIRSHFMVQTPTQGWRSEYLGGGSSPINVAPIAQTTPSSGGSTPLANLGGIGVSTCQHGFTKSFTEHCIVIGLANVRADLGYQQGLNKLWSRLTRYDFYWPSFANLGEQAVLSKELYLDGTSGDDDVFGYQERYAEYRYKPSMITGKFRSDATIPLDVWHLAQDFTGRPVLGKAFIEENPPITRVIATTSESCQFLFDSYFDFNCVRPMPVYSVPGLIDHF